MNDLGLMFMKHGAPTVEGDAHHKKKIKNRMATGKGPGSPGSMGSRYATRQLVYMELNIDSSGSLGSSDSTSNGNDSNGGNELLHRNFI